MTGPAPAVARVRSAVRATLQDVPAGQLVVAAVSGGRDSLALADALAFEAPRASLRAGAVIVNHQLQPGSDSVAQDVASTLHDLGLDPVEVILVDVGREGGPESAARDARYSALEQAAARMGAVAVLLGHTRDDQAETVLLGLARGSGARSLSGMAERRAMFQRPLLDIDRETTGAACAAAGLKPWEDPHNDDPSFARSRVRTEVLPTFEKNLGPGIAAALARTSRLLRDDDEALQGWAQKVLGEVTVEGESSSLNCQSLATAPAAVRRRALRMAALDAGSSPGGLRDEHLRAMDALVAAWHGQGPVDLPGGVRASRACGRLRFAREGGSSAGLPTVTEE